MAKVDGRLGKKKKEKGEKIVGRTRSWEKRRRNRRKSWTIPSVVEQELRELRSFPPSFVTAAAKTDVI